MATSKRPRKRRTKRPLQSWLSGSVRTDIEIMGFFFHNKLASGTFDALDSNTVAYLLNVTNKLAIDSGNTTMVEITDRAIAAYLGIRRRHDRTGQYGATGPELVTLKETMPEIANYFTTSPQHRLESARAYVLRVNEKMRKAGIVYGEPTRDGRIENAEMAA